MADKYVNEVGVQAIRTWADGKFALDSDLDALSTRVDGIVSQGGEPNVIETVKRNGTALVPDANKAVDILVPYTGTGEDGGTGGIYYSLTDEDGNTFYRFVVSANGFLVGLGTGQAGGGTTKELVDKNYVDANGGKIDKIKVNGTEQAITNKEVNITVPTAVSDLTNDSGYQTASDVQTAINSAVSSAYKYKGSVATVNDLPSSGNEVGDVYDVLATGVNYAWDGSAWDALGTYVDTSLLWAKSELVAMTNAEVLAILNATT